jgi:hypothetical protein
MAASISKRISPALRRLALAPLLLATSWVMAIAPTWAVAGEPLGFDGFAFGTTRSALVVEPIFRARCHPGPETQTVVRAQGSRVTCQTYELKDLGAMRVTLLFSTEDRLVGYVMYVARDRQTDVRTRIESLYGPPTRELEQGRTIAWLWPSGTEASLTVFCRGSDGCLTVKAKASEENTPTMKR